jgi:hypothetical protein
VLDGSYRGPISGANVGKVRRQQRTKTQAKPRKRDVNKRYRYAIGSDQKQGSGLIGRMGMGIYAVNQKACPSSTSE